MIRIAFTTNKDTVSANVTTVEKAADMLFMLLFAHGNDAMREALAAYDAFMLGVAEAHSDVTTNVGPDMIETYDAGRASVRGVED